MSASMSPREPYTDADADETTERCSATDLAAMRAAARASGSDDARTTLSGETQVIESLREISRAGLSAAPETLPLPLVTRALPAVTSTRRLAPDDTVSIRVSKRKRRRWDAWLVVAFVFAMVFGATCGVVFAEHAL